MRSHPRVLPVKVPSLGPDVTAVWVHQTKTLHPTPTPAPYVPPSRTETLSCPDPDTPRKFEIFIINDEPPISGMRESSLDYLEPLEFCNRIKFRFRHNQMALRRGFHRGWKVVRDFLEARFGSEYIDESARTDISIASYGTIDFRYTPEDDFYL